MHEPLQNWTETLIVHFVILYTFQITYPNIKKLPVNKLTLKTITFNFSKNDTSCLKFCPTLDLHLDLHLDDLFYDITIHLN